MSFALRRSLICMGKLIYGFNVSVDGNIADAQGNIDWSDPSEELHQYWNDFEAGDRPIVLRAAALRTDVRVLADRRQYPGRHPSDRRLRAHLATLPSACSRVPWSPSTGSPAWNAATRSRW